MFPQEGCLQGLTDAVAGRLATRLARRAVAITVPHHRDQLAAGDVVAGGQRHVVAATEQPGQLGTVREEREPAAHDAPRPMMT
jgi:hypothetical protein